MGTRCQNGSPCPASTWRCRVHHFSMGSLTTTNTSSQPKPVPIPSLGFAWFPFLGFGWPMLELAGVCWQKPVTTPPFRGGWMFLPWVPLVVFPGIAVGSWLARAKWAGPSSAFWEQSTDSGGNSGCAPAHHTFPLGALHPSRTYPKSIEPFFGMCLWDGSVTPCSSIPDLPP